MGQFAPVIAAAAAVGSALLGGAQSYKAGVSANQEYKQAAKNEADAQRSREIEKRRALLRALSSQNAQAGAQGVAFSGGKAAIAQQDIRDSRRDLLVDTVNSKRRQNLFITKGRSAQRAGEVAAVMSILDAGGKAASLK